MNKYSLGALAAAGLLAGGLATSANAADLGGNCCADLEERVAELEATTARKGNRKVSLTVSGWVGQQIMAWDDGFESNQYVGDLGTTLASHVKFTGQATIVPGWTAGYVLHLEMSNNDSLALNQNYQQAGLVGSWTKVTPLQSYWFIKSDSYGKIGVGRQSQASDNTAILVDGSGSLVPANWVAFDVASFQMRESGTGLNAGSWGAVGLCTGGGAWGDCNGNTQNVVRYDSPTFAGFSASASWGEDDMWDVALRYAGEHHGFKFAAAAAYNEITGGGFPNWHGGGVLAPETQYFQVGAYLQHVRTGLFLYGAYGHNELDFTDRSVAPGNEFEADQYYIKAGIRGKWHPLGATVLYGEYNNVQGDGGTAVSSPVGVNDLNTTVSVGAGLSDELEVWGLGVVQEIDAAAMSLWISYRHLSYDHNNAAVGQIEDFDYVKAGALINF
ncbi:porin [Hyphomicrobium sp.]|uniref:porin n=1 Tax=Hyphomicrobium sp. TaxID=82 RepID=UPI002E33FE62|nr:porin [Hyphomicrobium sp.]HEX2843233.1 porin [Hyphomicrobium sp.]